MGLSVAQAVMLHQVKEQRRRLRHAAGEGGPHARGIHLDGGHGVDQHVDHVADHVQCMDGAVGNMDDAVADHLQAAGEQLRRFAEHARHPGCGGPDQAKGIGIALVRHGVAGAGEGIGEAQEAELGGGEQEQGLGEAGEVRGEHRERRQHAELDVQGAVGMQGIGQGGGKAETPAEPPTIDGRRWRHHLADPGTGTVEGGKLPAHARKIVEHAVCGGGEVVAERHRFGLLRPGMPGHDRVDVQPGQRQGFRCQLMRLPGHVQQQVALDDVPRDEFAFLAGAPGTQPVADVAARPLADRAFDVGLQPVQFGVVVDGAKAFLAQFRQHGEQRLDALARQRAGIGGVGEVGLVVFEQRRVDPFAVAPLVSEGTHQGGMWM